MCICDENFPRLTSCYVMQESRQMSQIRLHDVVALTQPLPEHNLRRGDIGVVIDAGPNAQYLVEFSDRNGVPYATPTVSADGLMKVYLQPGT